MSHWLSRGIVFGVLFGVALSVHAVQGEMILYLPMDSADNNVVADASGNRRDGLVVGAAKVVSGKFNKALEVGAADEVQIEDKGDLDLMTALTAEMWVYMETQQATGLIQKGTDWGANMSYLIQPWSDGNIYFGIKETSSRAITKAGDFPLKKWYHLAATYDGKMLRLYIDGTMKAEAPPPAGVKEVPDTKNPLQIGNRFIGQMDDFILYKRALSADEIHEDMLGRVLAVSAIGKTATLWGRLKERLY